MSGLFITFEGVDGSGKSSQAKLLKEYLEKQNFHVLCTREPGGNPISEKIREIIINPENKAITAITEALLYAAARAQLVEEVIKPELKCGNIVICDRYVDSSVVYQGVARGLGSDVVMDLNIASNNLMPDITFFLKITHVKALLRKKKQHKLDRIESEKSSFHKKVYNGYINLAAKYPERIKIIDAYGDKESIHRQIVKHIDKLFRERSLTL